MLVCIRYGLFLLSPAKIEPSVAESQAVCRWWRAALTERGWATQPRAQKSSKATRHRAGEFCLN